MKQTVGVLGRRVVGSPSGQVARPATSARAGMAERGIGSATEVVSSECVAGRALPATVAGGSLRFSVHPHELAAQGSLRLCQSPALEFAQRRALPASTVRRGRTGGCHQPAGAAEARDRHVIQSTCKAVVAGSAEGDPHHLLDDVLARQLHHPLGAPWPQLRQLAVQPVSEAPVALATGPARSAWSCWSLPASRRRPLLPRCTIYRRSSKRPRRCWASW